LAMAMTQTGVDLKTLWEIKASTLANLRGLALSKGTTTLADVKGMDQMVKMAYRLFDGPEPPAILVFLDELTRNVENDKNGQNLDGGASSYILSQLLTRMEDNGWYGQWLYGVPGTGKSFFAKCFANTFGIKTIVQNLNSAKGMYVGSTEQQSDEQFDCLTAMGGNRVMFLGCSNSANMTPALQRRFRLGRFFTPLPGREEKDQLWQQYGNIYKIKLDSIPNDDGYVGANVRDACEMAWRLNTSLEEAAEYITPVGKADPDDLRKTYENASGRFLNCNKPGTYIYNPNHSNEEKPSSTAKRRINFDKGVN